MKVVLGIICGLALAVTAIFLLASSSNPERKICIEMCKKEGIACIDRASANNDAFYQARLNACVNDVDRCVNMNCN